MDARYTGLISLIAILGDELYCVIINSSSTGRTKELPVHFNLKEICKVKKIQWKATGPVYMDKTDKRYKNSVKQIKKLGFSDSDTWA